MGARRIYEIGYWVEEKDNIIGFNLTRDKVQNEFLNTLIEEAVKDWKNQNNGNPLIHSNLWKTVIDDKKPNFLQSIRKLYSFTYYAVIKFLLIFEKRIFSVLREDHEALEWLRAHLIDWVIEKDENGANKDTSIDTSIVRPPSIYNSSTSTPEQALHDTDFYEKIKKLLAIIEASGKKNASKFYQILEMELLDGIHVTSKYGSILGIAKRQVASLRFQAFKLVKKIAKKQFPELADFIENLNRGTAHKVKKSTKKEIEKINRLNNDDESKKHGPIKIVDKDGNTTTISYEESLKLRDKLPRRGRKKKALANPEAQIKMLVPVLDQ